MRADDLLVEVRDKELVRLGAIATRDLNIEVERRDRAPGSWQIRLPTEHHLVPKLRVPGAGVIVTHKPTGRVLISGPARHPEMQASSDDPSGLVTVTGDGDSCLLWQVLIRPNPLAAVDAQTSSHYVATGVAETVMLTLVNVNAGPGALAARRSIDLLASDQARGPVVERSERFTVLGAVLADIAGRADLGFDVVQIGGQLRFDVLDVLDRTGDVRLDVRNGTLADVSSSVSLWGPTRAIMAGQGQGADRAILERTTATSLAVEAAYGRWGRSEAWFDRRDVEDVTELAQAGDQIIADAAAEAVAVAAVPGDDTATAWPVDCSPGDAVAVVVDGVEQVARVASVKLIADADGARTGGTLGNLTDQTPTGAVARAVAAVSDRVGLLERTVEQAPAVSERLVGEIVPWAGTGAVPAGWLPCAGGAVNRAAYPALFAVIGTTYGAGNGSTTFNLPDLRGRVPVGVDSTQSEFDAIGKAGGAKTHTLTAQEMPSHTHTQNAHTHTLSNATVASSTHTHSVAGGVAWAMIRMSVTTARQIVQRRIDGLTSWTSTHALTPNSTAGSGDTNTETTGTQLGGNTAGPSATTTVSAQSTTATNLNAGGGQAHNNMPPYLVMRYLIKT